MDSVKLMDDLGLLEAEADNSGCSVRNNYSTRSRGHICRRAARARARPLANRPLFYLRAVLSGPHAGSPRGCKQMRFGAVKPEAGDDQDKSAGNIVYSFPALTVISQQATRGRARRHEASNMALDKQENESETLPPHLSPAATSGGREASPA